MKEVLSERFENETSKTIQRQSFENQVLLIVLKVKFLIFQTDNSLKHFENEMFRRIVFEIYNCHSNLRAKAELPFRSPRKKFLN